MVACGFRRPRAVSGYRCGNYKAYRYRCFLGARTSAARFHQKHCFSLVDRDATAIAAPALQSPLRRVSSPTKAKPKMS